MFIVSLSLYEYKREKKDDSSPFLMELHDVPFLKAERGQYRSTPLLSFFCLGTICVCLLPFTSIQYNCLDWL